jgi:hypothetical protein
MSLWQVVDAAGQCSGGEGASCCSQPPRLLLQAAPPLRLATTTHHRHACYDTTEVATEVAGPGHRHVRAVSRLVEGVAGVPVCRHAADACQQVKVDQYMTPAAASADGLELHPLLLLICWRGRTVRVAGSLSGIDGDRCRACSEMQTWPTR